MKKHALISISILTFILGEATAFAGVTVTSPSNGSTVGSSVSFVATSTTSCSKGVAAMGIYPSAYQLAYTVDGASLNTTLGFGVINYRWR